MTTLWKWRLFLFVRAVDATNANKSALATIYVNNGSGETLANEKLMFNSVTRFSLTGLEPATVYGLNLTAHTGMKDQFVTLIGGLTNARWAVVANTTLANYADGELVATNFPVTPAGQIVTWEMGKQYLFNQFGLMEIVPPDPFAAVALRGPDINIAGRIVLPAYTTPLGEAIWNRDAAKVGAAIYNGLASAGRKIKDAATRARGRGG